MTAVKFDVLRSIDFTSITSSYQPLGAPLTHNWRIFKVTNTCDNNIILSVDGVSDNILVTAGGFTLYDFGTNEPGIASQDSMVVSIGTQFYVKASSFVSYGKLFLEGVYS